MTEGIVGYQFTDNIGVMWTVVRHAPWNPEYVEIEADGYPATVRMASLVRRRKELENARAGDVRDHTGQVG